MRRACLAVLALPLLLAACDSAPQAPASSAPPAEPAAAAPAAEAPAATAPAAPSAGLNAATMAPLIGSWAVDAAGCATPIVTTATSFRGAENVCEITGWTDNGDGTYTAALTCTGEGQTINERIAMTPLFGPTGEGIRLDYVDRGSDPVTVFRCPTPRSQ